ncbi:hypothetical protein BHM03_00029386 [Ensete ventricosum]|nr:hypothetical protein BHM03_00029386 [Ensete ventricosum]
MEEEWLVGSLSLWIRGAFPRTRRERVGWQPWGEGKRLRFRLSHFLPFRVGKYRVVFLPPEAEQPRIGCPRPRQATASQTHDGQHQQQQHQRGLSNEDDDMVRVEEGGGSSSS